MGIEGPKLVDTIALMQLAFSFATFALFAAKTSEHVGRDVNIRPFLLQFYDANFPVCCFIAVSALGAYGWHPNLISVVVSFDDLKTLDFRNCPQIDSLALDSLGIVWVCADTCGVEFDRRDSMVAFDQCACERKRVKPFGARIVAEKSIIEIPCININVCLHLIKMLRLRPFWIGASPRVGRASRSEMNPLTGSVGIIPNLHAVRKGANFVGQKVSNCKFHAKFSGIV